MSSDWYSTLLERIESAHMSLMSAKAYASGDWAYELKYQLKAFRAGAVLIGETKPDTEETRESYLGRVAPLIEALPAAVGKEDLDAWRDGMRELSRVL